MHCIIEDKHFQVSTTHADNDNYRVELSWLLVFDSFPFGTSIAPDSLMHAWIKHLYFMYYWLPHVDEVCWMENPSADLSQKFSLLFGSQPVCHCKLMSIESIEV